MNDLSNPFQIPSNPTPSTSSHTASSVPTKTAQNQLLTKLGQSSTSSPRTESNNRRRFGGLFASFGLSNGNGSPLRAPTQSKLQTPIKVRRSPLKESNDEEDREGEDGGTGVGVGEGISGGIWNFAERMKGLTLGTPKKGKGKEVDIGAGEDNGRLGGGVGGLPDEIILHILLQLPPTISQLHLVSLISTRFYDLSRTPILWLRIFHEAGFGLNEDARDNGIAVEYPPKGEWKGVEWIDYTSDQSSNSSSLEAAEGIIDDEVINGSIPIHYPTLVKSRFALQSLLEDSDYIPNPRTLSGHKDVIYCLAQWKNYLFTGSRDRSIRIYDLTSQNQDQCIHVEEDVHDRSVLCLDLNLDDNGKGLLVSGSSDSSIGVFQVDLSLLDPTSPSSSEGKILNRVKTIKGTSSILSIAISSKYIISSSKDSKINIYDRTNYELIKTLEGHTQSVNSISLSPDQSKLVSGSGDGTWKIWNLDSGVMERKGGEGRGVACVDWSDEYISTGDGDNLVKMYSASTGELLKAFEGHTDLVRSISMNKSAGVMISASYDKTIRMWNTKSGKLIKIVNEDRSSLIFDLIMIAGQIIAARQDGSVHIFNFGENLPYIDLFI